jgi:trans-2,3-dihydro-3-hydroxyanthranilate isomerase
LPSSDIDVQVHAPQVVSVGLPFLVVGLLSREALRRAKPNLAAFAEHLPLDGADAVFTYCRDPSNAATGGTILHARMFSPLDGIVEDPATGSACAATIALLASLHPQRPEQQWRIHQGVDMNRPSLLLGRTSAREGGTVETFISGRCVAVFEGSFDLGETFLQ